MERIKRRHFLQLAGSTLTTLGWSRARFLGASNSYGKVLAESTSRKLALLIGINKYSCDFGGWIPLKGCTTDIQLQRELLINCFGFKSQDILLLKDKDATRDKILTAFEEHLIKQARSGDIVVFHYSGHGSRVMDAESEDGINGTLVPIDSPYPSSENLKVRDIMGHTLFLLSSALKTDNVTMVLDCCYSGGTTRGNLRIRSRSSNDSLEVMETEKEYQQKWLSRLNLSPQEFIQRRQQSIAKGVAITSAKKNQLAADVSFDGFAAGAFTYALTQYLWQQTVSAILYPTIAHTQNAIANIAPSSLQEPMLETAPNISESNSVYFLDKQIPPASAVITKVVDNSVELWLGGISAGSINAFDSGSTFFVIDSGQNQIATVRLDSRDGLVGYGTLAVNPQQGLSRGNLLQEEIRSIPMNLKLKIGVDDEQKELWEEVKEAFSSLERVEVLPLQQEEVDYIFAPYREQVVTEGKLLESSKSSFALFYPDLTIVPNSFYPNSESISATVELLKSKLKSLLAIKLIRLTLNSDSSHLKVAASLYSGQNPQKPLAEAFSAKRSLQQDNLSLKSGSVSLNTSLQIAIANKENRPLHISVLTIDSAGEIAVIFPNHWTELTENTTVAPGETLMIPQTSTSGFELRSAKPLGFTEVLVVASTMPFKKSLGKLEQIARSNHISNGAIPLTHPWEVIEDLIVDLDTNTRNGETVLEKKASYLIDTTQLAILYLGFEVVA